MFANTKSNDSYKCDTDRNVNCKSSVESLKMKTYTHLCFLTEHTYMYTNIYTHIIMSNCHSLIIILSIVSIGTVIVIKYLIHDILYALMINQFNKKQICIYCIHL